LFIEINSSKKASLASAYARESKIGIIHVLNTYYWF